MARNIITYTFFLLFALSTLPHLTSPRSIDGGFSIQLIHRDSHLSPFYDPTAIASNPWKSWYRRSYARYNYLRPRTNRTSPHAIQAPVFPGNGEYLMRLAIGTPPVEVVANFDTGSNLIWIQCLRCEQCFPQNAPIYDPSKSLSFEKLFCSAQACRYLSNSTCMSAGYDCMYEYSYQDGSSTEGELAMDAFTFSLTDGGGNVTLPSINFGCGRDNSGNFHKEEAGVVGMNMGSLSLISQMGDDAKGRFSYCLVPNWDKDSGSQMVFGDRAVLIGSGTPLVTTSTPNYYVNLDDISVGSERLNIPPGMFHRGGPEGDSGLIIDSGTTLTLLRREGYDMLVKKLKEVVPLNLVDQPYLCFEGTARELEEDGKVPVLTFHFEGLDVRLEALYTFMELYPGNICLLMQAAMNDVSIFGVYSQQNMNVGYDIGGQKIYMAPCDCATF